MTKQRVYFDCAKLLGRESKKTNAIQKTELKLDFRYDTVQLSDVANLVDRFEGRLEKFHFDCSCITSTVVDPPLIDALKACNRLSELYWDSGAPHATGLAFSIVQPLLLHPGNVLETINVTGMWHGRSGQFFGACGASSTLKHLKFETHCVDKIQLKHLAKFIRESSTIETLEFRAWVCRSIYGGDETIFDDNLADIASSLTHNESIKSLSLVFDGLELDRNCLLEAKYFCDALQHNNAIENLIVTPWKESQREPKSKAEYIWVKFGHRIPSEEEDAFLANLSGIYMLESFNSPEGKQRLLSPEANQRDWLKALAYKDVPLVYFLLRQKPSILTTYSTATEKPSGGRRKKKTTSSKKSRKPKRCLGT